MHSLPPKNNLTENGQLVKVQGIYSKERAGFMSFYRGKLRLEVLQVKIARRH